MNCKTCKHWTFENAGYDGIANPIDPDTYEPMKMPFEVRRCGHPELMFCERPLDPIGFAVADGSTYMADLYTAEDFGCIRHEVLS